MLSYGLKPYNQEDCEEALEISRSLKGIDNKMDFIIFSIDINNTTPRGISLLEAPDQGRSNCYKVKIVLRKETNIRKDKMR